MRIAYQSKRFQKESLDLISACNATIEQYQAEHYVLTLRQIFYQLVSQELVENTEKQYNRVGRIVGEGRECGLIDWDAIEDRSRNLAELDSWDGPRFIIQDCANWFQFDPWDGQPYHVEIWVEKEALAGVVERTADRLGCSSMACKGYNSKSEMQAAGRRYRAISRRQDVVVVYLGDHDPSGVDMARDISVRLERYAKGPIKVHRAALTSAQIHEHNLPPLYTKKGDSRSAAYLAKYGEGSWELDALNPKTLDGIITDAVEQYLDRDLFDKRIAETEKGRRQLRTVEANWDAIVALDLPEPKDAA